MVPFQRLLLSEWFVVMFLLSHMLYVWLIEVRFASQQTQATSHHITIKHENNKYSKWGSKTVWSGFALLLSQSPLFSLLYWSTVGWPYTLNLTHSIFLFTNSPVCVSLFFSFLDYTVRTTVVTRSGTRKMKNERIAVGRGQQLIMVEHRQCKWMATRYVYLRLWYC